MVSVLFSCYGTVTFKGADYAKATLLVKARDITSFNNPRARDYDNVRAYFDEKAPIREVERHIYHRDDILTLTTGREDAWLDIAVETMVDKCDGRFTRVSLLYASHQRFVI